MEIKIEGSGGRDERIGVVGLAGMGMNERGEKGRKGGREEERSVMLQVSFFLQGYFFCSFSCAGEHVSLTPGLRVSFAIVWDG